jgi:hypothetical protein
LVSRNCAHLSVSAWLDPAICRSLSGATALVETVAQTFRHASEGSVAEGSLIAIGSDLAMPNMQSTPGLLLNHQTLSAFTRSDADLLRGDYKQSDYGKVILPPYFGQWSLCRVIGK